MDSHPRLRGLLASLMLLAGPAAAGTILVPQDKPGIQAAINAAVDGDVVLVSPGTYFEKLDFLGKKITVASTGGAAVTILDGNGGGPLVSFTHAETSASVLQGFTLTHAENNGPGSAIFASVSSPTIEDNVFDSNIELSGYWGGAIGGNSASPRILRNYFTANTCGSNIYDSVVGFANNSSPVIADNVFANNPCPALLFILPAGAAPKVYNNTMVGNRKGLVASFYGNPASEFYSNNILVSNQVGFQASFNGGATLPSWTNNLVYGNSTADYQGVADQTGSNGNLSADPLFSDAADGDLRLATGSPAIDAGDSSVSQLSGTDFYGNTRVNGSVDIGADEYYPPFGVLAASLDVQSRDGFKLVALLTSSTALPDFSTRAVELKLSGPGGTLLDVTLPAGSLEYWHKTYRSGLLGGQTGLTSLSIKLLSGNRFRIEAGGTTAGTILGGDTVTLGFTADGEGVQALACSRSRKLHCDHGLAFLLRH